MQLKSKYKYIGLLHADDFYKNNNVFKNISNEFRSNINYYLFIPILNL